MRPAAGDPLQGLRSEALRRAGRTGSGARTARRPSARSASCAGRHARPPSSGTAARQLGAGPPDPCDLGHGGEDRLGHVAQDVELQTWCGTSPRTAAIASGYSNKPSVVIPWTVNPRASKATRKAEECLDVDLGRVAVQDVVGQPFEGALNETLRWTRSTLAPFAMVRLFSLVPHLLPVVLIISVATI